MLRGCSKSLKTGAAATGLAALLGVLLAAPAAAATDPLPALAWLRHDSVQWRSLHGNPGGLAAGHSASRAATVSPGKVPLGSLWKLFVYAYLAQSQAPERPYVCSNQSQLPLADERYCCAPGERIERDTALSRSCAPYFDRVRLGLTGRAWQAHWHSRNAAAWLLDIERLQPATEVEVADLLRALAVITPAARNQARRALHDTGLHGYGRQAWTRLGSGIRYKTYSWHRPDGSAVGGAAGWLVDGTPFWFGARGSSRSALSTWASALAAALPPPDWRAAGLRSSDSACVDVDFFARYPLQAVWLGDAAQPARAGALKDTVRLQFANGNWLTVRAQGELQLALTDRRSPTIAGRFGLNDYVARVIDREGQASPAQAARALAIAVRSYLLQNAHFEGGCWRIADTSATQRVSPNPASAAALDAAWFTDDIVLSGAPVNYHQQHAGNNRLAWSEARARAAEGWDFERILAASFPQGTLAGLDGRLECTRLDAAESWLAAAARRWQHRLQHEPGFEAPPTTPRICALGDGHPYADQQRLRIYVRGWRSQDERITLAHEYLHLALRFHPNGSNEAYIERLARHLIES